MGQGVPQAQEEQSQVHINEGIEHLIQSQNPDDTIREMHAQQRRERQGEVLSTQRETPLPQDNLITFTPTPTRDNPGADTSMTVEGIIGTRQGLATSAPQQEPKLQRTERTK